MPRVYPEYFRSGRSLSFEILRVSLSQSKSGAILRKTRARQVMMSPHRLAVSLFAALLSTFTLSAGGARAQTTVTSERPASFTLGNGLQVVVIPDHRTPVVTQMIWYKVGSADE